MYKRETEIRHLSSADVYKLGLELEQSWKKLMRIIPKDLSQIKTSVNLAVAGSFKPTIEPFTSKYTNDHILMVEKASRDQNRLSTEILLEEWGTSGRIRPNVGNLLDLLINAEIYRAADFVAVYFLNESPPQRPLTGPAAKIDISIPLQTEEVKQIESILNDIGLPGTQSLNQNAQLGSELNNKDYYEKFKNEEKKLGIEYSDLIKFSSSTIASTSQDDFVSLSANIPNISEILETKNELIPHHNNTYKSNNANEQNNEIYQNGQSYDNMEDDDDDDEDDNIPILSALNVQDLSNDEQFPDLSILNPESNNGSGSGGGNGNNTGENTSNNSRSGSFGNSSSLSTNTDDGSNIISNLSILDQKSNDDSSLTNVTDTSENISFENDNTNPANINDNAIVASSNNDITCSIIDSRNNVPCLSDLNISES